MVHAREQRGVLAVARGEPPVERGHREDVLAVLALVGRHEGVEALEEPRLLRGVGDRLLLVVLELVRLDALALLQDVGAVLVDGGHGVEVRGQPLLREAERADGREPARDARGVDLTALAAAKPVDEGRGAGVGADDAGVDGAQLEWRVRDGTVEPAHHVHVREEARQRTEVVLIDVVGQVAEALVAGQGGHSAHHDLVRQSRDGVVLTVDDDDVGRRQRHVRRFDGDL